MKKPKSTKTKSKPSKQSTLFTQSFYDTVPVVTKSRKSKSKAKPENIDKMVVKAAEEKKKTKKVLEDKVKKESVKIKKTKKVKEDSTELFFNSVVPLNITPPELWRQSMDIDQRKYEESLKGSESTESLEFLSSVKEQGVFIQNPEYPNTTQYGINISEEDVQRIRNESVHQFEAVSTPTFDDSFYVAPSLFDKIKNFFGSFRDYI